MPATKKIVNGIYKPTGEPCKLREYICREGLLWKQCFLPLNHCCFCKHCTDVFWDFTNGPYLTLCELYDSNECKEKECFEEEE